MNCFNNQDACPECVIELEGFQRQTEFLAWNRATNRPTERPFFVLLLLFLLFLLFRSLICSLIPDKHTQPTNTMSSCKQCGKTRKQKRSSSGSIKHHKILQRKFPLYVLSCVNYLFSERMRFRPSISKIYAIQIHTLIDFRIHESSEQASRCDWVIWFVAILISLLAPAPIFQLIQPFATPFKHIGKPTTFSIERHTVTTKACTTFKQT